MVSPHLLLVLSVLQPRAENRKSWCERKAECGQLGASRPSLAKGNNFKVLRHQHQLYILLPDYFLQLLALQLVLLNNILQRGLIQSTGKEDGGCVIKLLKG